MTRTFRLGLFLCLAAAAGLHVRPCVVSLLRCGFPGAESADGSRPTAARPPARALASAALSANALPASELPARNLPTNELASTGRVRRPQLESMGDGPEFIDVQTAIADVR